MISRNQEHELIMISIYDAIIYTEMDEIFSLEDVMEGIYMIPYDDIPFFSREVVIKSLANINDIKAIFQKNMPKWKFDRLNALERAILLMSYTHSKLEEKADKKVKAAKNKPVSNRGVKVAKQKSAKSEKASSSSNSSARVSVRRQRH